MGNRMHNMETHRPSGEREWNTERGGVLVMALFLTIFSIGVVVSGTMTMKSNRTRIETSFLLSGQASGFARSGMTEAISWFRAQRIQPVATFAPQLDPSADPPVLDTEDPDIGLVREFRITGDLFGRYEVWKEWDTDPDPVRSRWRDQLKIQDVSAKRGNGTPGMTWRLMSTGYVFVKRDPAKGYREYPNRVIASETLESEISRMAFALPGQAAICAQKGGDINIGTNARVSGGADGAGTYYPSSTGTPAVATDGSLDGVQPLAPTSFYDDSTAYMFGVSDAKLNSMADQYLTNNTDFPAMLPAGTMTILDAPSEIHFDAARPLSGAGIVVIRGDVSIDAGSSSVFRGVLIVVGDLTIKAPCLIHGAVVATGKVALSGIGDYVDIAYHDDAINDIQMTMANYRVSRAPRLRSMRSE